MELFQSLKLLFNTMYHIYHVNILCVATGTYPGRGPGPPGSCLDTISLNLGPNLPAKLHLFYG